MPAATVRVLWEIRSACKSRARKAKWNQCLQVWGRCARIIPFWSATVNFASSPSSSSSFAFIFIHNLFMHAIAAKVKWNNLQYEMFQCFISRITRIENGALKYRIECTMQYNYMRTTLVLWVGACCAAMEWWLSSSSVLCLGIRVLRVDAEYLSNVRQRWHTTCGIKVEKVVPDTWAALRSTLKLRLCYGCLLLPSEYDRHN